MTVLPDANVLIYAFRTDFPQHTRCRAWLTAVVGRPDPFGLASPTLAALVRITTNRKVFPEPSTADEAFSFCDALRSQPNCLMIEPGPRHWDIFRRLCLETGTIGARTTDAWLAALAIESSCEWITLDRDFGRFPGLHWRGPE